jgi:hypothetical protein
MVKWGECQTGTAMSNKSIATIAAIDIDIGNNSFEVQGESDDQQSAPAASIPVFNRAERERLTPMLAALNGRIGGLRAWPGAEYGGNHACARSHVPVARARMSVYCFTLWAARTDFLVETKVEVTEKSPCAS